MELIFATQNAHKLSEVSQILGNSVSLKSLRDLNFTDDIPETADTLAGNSLQKAQYIWDKFGINCFADDTGLCVPALNGEPGVYSARYASIYGGHDHDSAANRQVLLQRLAEKTDRSAYFSTVVTLIIEGKSFQFEGRVDGVITTEEQGDGGFGYDCIFQPQGYDKTFAQLPAEVKNSISHRGRAMAKLADFLLRGTL